VAFASSELEFHLTLAQLTPSTHVATVSGELDLHTEPDLRSQLAPVAAEPGTTLIADLCAVPFVDSTALGALTAIAKQLRAGGGDLVVVSDDPRLRRLLEITGLLAVLDVETSLARAVERVVGSTAV
jgi:anti-sigma B factor antagonist